MKKSFFNQLFPQNYIIAYPLPGVLILFGFSLLFTIFYQPLSTHQGDFLNFELTMLIYSVGIALTAFAGIYMMRLVPYFHIKKTWTFGREVLAIFFLMLLMGITVFFLAFFIEPPAATTRWNWDTFFDSFARTFFIAVVPFVYFTSLNLTVFFRSPKTPQRKADELKSGEGKKIDISSQLKNESLQFLEDELLYATSDGNYVVFYLFQEGRIKKIPIRNSITEIEKQLESFPSLVRCHRAYIVNIRQVTKKIGNSLGYRLSLSHTSKIIPVSRSRIYEFDSRYC